jgi:hypothetical protein
MLSGRILTSAIPVPNTNPLGIKLVSFTGKALAGKNILSWTTVTETNVARFEVQRSIDGRNYRSIGSIDSKYPTGTGTFAMDYEYTDGAPLSKVFYRLYVIDRDGSSSYSQVVAVNNMRKLDDEVSIFPNPSTGVITLDGLGAVEGHITILNSYGQSIGYELIDAASQHSKTIRIMNPIAGFYYVKYEVNGAAYNNKVLIP